MCEQPDVDASIGFFDGFDVKTVGITYGSLIVFTIIWQIYIQCLRKPKIDKEWDKIVQENTSKYMGSMHSMYSGSQVEYKNIN